MNKHKLEKFSKLLGFEGFRLAKTKNKEICGFYFETFDIDVLRAHLGRHRKHSPDGRFIFVVEKNNKIIRLDTKKNVVLLGDGLKAFKAIMKSL